MIRRLFAAAGLTVVLFASAPVALAQCVAPDAPQIIFTPPGSVGVGQTYSIIWGNVANLDAAGDYIVERSTSPSFAGILDSQETSSTAASFVTSAEGPIYHRVRAVAGCDAAKVSANSAVKSVNVVSAPPDLIFTVQPKPVFVPIGAALDKEVMPFYVENIGKSTVTAIVSGQAIGGPAFFTVVDPDPDPSQPDAITLAPHTPKKLELHFLPLATTAPAAHQGFFYLLTQPDPPAVTPYSFVNVKIGTNDSTAPLLQFKGINSEYAFFAPYSASAPNAAHPTISVDVLNPGDTPMTVGAEIGPEAWLVPNAGWNAEAIPPHSKVTVTLAADRARSAPGAAYPRYTFLTVRSKSGGSARMLVQDNDAPSQGAGRAALAQGVRSYTVPQVVGADGASGRVVSRIRLSNVSGGALNAELLFTPAGADGNDPVRVSRATVVVPPNDVVTITDPLLEIFSLASPAAGQMEVRAAADRVASLNVAAETIVPRSSGGLFSYRVPVLQRGEGAARGNPHALTGIVAAANVKPTLVLAETTGFGAAGGQVTVFDQNGTRVGQTSFSVPANGFLQLDDVLSAVGAGTSFQTGRVQVDVSSGDGSAAAMAVLLDRQQGSGAVIVGQPLTAAPTSAGAHRRAAALGVPRGAASTIQRFIIPAVSNGQASGVPSISLATAVTITASDGGEGTVTLNYLDAVLGGARSAPVLHIPKGGTLEIANILEQLFQLPKGTASQGTVVMDANSVSLVSARLTSGTTTTPVGTPPLVYGAVPVLSSIVEAFTSGLPKLQRTLFFDGLEQSVDTSRGRRWDLLLSEITGQPLSVIVRLYEAGNRFAPIAELPVSLKANEQRRLSTVFASLGLDSESRRKDRTNVMVTVTPDNGSGVIAATAIGTDNATGDTTTFSLTPTGGLPPTGVEKVNAVPPPPQQAPSKKRVVRH